MFGDSECVLCRSICDDKHFFSSFNKIRAEIVASTTCSSAVILLFTPINVIKTRYQADLNSKNIQRSMLKVYRENGLPGYWAGTRVGLLQAVPTTVVYMTTYERMKELTLKYLPQAYESLGPGIAGGISRTLCVSITAPLEHVRTLQSNGTTGTLITIGRNLFQKYGLSGLYRGVSYNLLRDVPFSVLYWSHFEWIKSTMKEHQTLESKKPNNFFQTTLNDNTINFLSGTLSASIAAVITHPFDVLKTSQQTSYTSYLKNSISSNHPLTSCTTTTTHSQQSCTHSHYSSIHPSTVCVRYQSTSLYPSSITSYLNNLQMVTKLYRGLYLRVFTLALSNGIMITVYDSVKRYFEKVLR